MPLRMAVTYRASTGSESGRRGVGPVCAGGCLNDGAATGVGRQGRN